MIVRDHKDAAALAVDASVRRAAAGGWRRCEETNEADARCVYGAGHSIETHLFADGSRS